MTRRYHLNGIDVDIIGIEVWERRGGIYFRLYGEEFTEGIEEVGNGYKLMCSKAEFTSDTCKYYTRCITGFETDAEYLEFLSSLYDCLQDYLKNC